MITQLSKEIATGKLLFECKWGEAKLNGVHLRNCVHLASYEKGILISIMSILHSKDLWLPRNELIIGTLQTRKHLAPESRVIESREHKVILLGRLAKNGV